jgi:hypothetical protein
MSVGEHITGTEETLILERNFIIDGDIVLGLAIFGKDNSPSDKNVVQDCYYCR